MYNHQGNWKITCGVCIANHVIQRYRLFDSSRCILSRTLHTCVQCICMISCGGTCLRCCWSIAKAVCKNKTTQKSVNSKKLQTNSILLLQNHYQYPFKRTKCLGSFEKSLFNADISPSAFSKIFIKIGILRGEMMDKLMFLWKKVDKNMHRFKVMIKQL